MINKKRNLTLKLNKSVNNLANDNLPNTPLEQTVSTPLNPPMNPQVYANNGVASGYNPIYMNQNYNESDEILTDVDDAGISNKSYTLNFTPKFDKLVMSIYSHIKSLPTTTPFPGNTPPSGLASKVANETMNNLIVNTSSEAAPSYDHQSMISHDGLRNTQLQPIYLQLIRKRLIDLCNFGGNANTLPKATTVTVGTSSTARQSSISNLSISELNLNTFSQNNQSNETNQNRSRSSSSSLRKQSMTRNNSHGSGGKMYMGGFASFKPPYANEGHSTSTDLLQSVQDSVSQSFINRTVSSNGMSTTPIFPPAPSFTGGMTHYQTPPSSSKGSFSTPPQTVQIIHGNNVADVDDFNINQFQLQRDLSNSRSNFVPHALTINTDSANRAPLSTSNNSFNNSFNPGLESPFMSSANSSEEYSYFTGSSSMFDTPTDEQFPEGRINIPGQFSLNEKKRDSLKMKRGIH